jgi:signal transduction histidine kinase
MTESFPSTPRAPSVIRLGAVAIGVAAMVLATHTTVRSLDWIGRPFPGFVLIDNRVVASVGLAHWPGSGVPGLYQSEVLALDGKPVASTEEIYARVRAVPIGTTLRYLLRSGGAERQVEIRTQLFTLRDWLLLFGNFLLNGGIYLASGLVVWVLRPRGLLGQAFLALGLVWGLFLFTAMDLYGPATFFRLHVLVESLLPPTVLQVVLLFPQPHALARWRWVGYLPALVIAGLYERFLYVPAAYSTILSSNMTYLGLVGVLFGVRLVREYWHGSSPLARQRIRIVTLGTLGGFSIPAGIVLASVLTGSGYGINQGAFTQFLFSLSLAYAVVKHDLFEIDAMVKRGAYYLLLTGAVGATYVAAVVLLSQVLAANAITESRAFPVLFTLAVLLVFDPLRTRLQAFVDRVFFRTAYDAARVLAVEGRQLASTLKREGIAALVREAVESAIPNGRTRLFVRGADGRLQEPGGGSAAPPALVRLLAEGRVLTAYDSAELYPDPATHEAVRAALGTLGAQIAVPLRLRGEVVGVLTAGAKRGGLFYTAGDAEFLRALAQQAAIALENAGTYEAVVELNARLEDRVRERTAQLEAANRELADAYGELKSAETQLVHAEKMASLGRLVAGVAHEINNPVSFISSNIAPLTRRLSRAAAAAPPPAQKALREAEELAGIMGRGAERTAAIVRDLRTFSRLGEAKRKAVDLHEGLEVTVRLLEPQWRDRITIHRDYGTLPPVECDPGQLNQVLMNLLENACDAIAGTGNIWIGTRADTDTVEISIRDDGRGIPPEVVGRIFDPFFTTKDVGRGTGLGLAVSHTVIASHGGRIAVESTPGVGTTFRVTLPASARLASASGAA